MITKNYNSSTSNKKHTFLSGEIFAGVWHDNIAVALKRLKPGAGDQDDITREATIAMYVTVEERRRGESRARRDRRESEAKVKESLLLLVYTTQSNQIVGVCFSHILSLVMASGCHQIIPWIVTWCMNFVMEGI